MNATIVSRVLDRYSERFRALRIETVESCRGFSGATICRVETPCGPHALRGWPADALPLERIRELHRLLAHVFDDGVAQVPVPVAALNGETVVDVHSRYWQLEPWLPGDADFHSRPNEARLHAATRCLAAFHRATGTWGDAVNFPESRWFYRRASAPSSAVRERLDRLQRWMTGDCERLCSALRNADQDDFALAGREFLSLFQQAAPHVADRLSATVDKPFRLQPCLRDVWHDHVLFTGDEVTGLIDASACRSDHVAVDLSRLLGSLVSNDRNAWDFALDVYSSERELKPDERRLVALLDRSGILLSGMTWLDRRYLQRTTFTHPGQVLERLQHFLSRLREFSDSVFR